jgi:KDO2-lipid IV(A) lauroyltransferase
MRDAFEYFFFRLLYGFVRLFPFRVVQTMGRAFGNFIFSVVGFRKDLVLSNLRHAFPEKSGKEIVAIGKASTQNLFTAFFEIAYLDKLSPEKIKELIAFPDAERITGLLRQGKGLIILTGHFGNWELAALATPVFVPNSYTIIVQQQRNRYVDMFMRRMRSRFGSKLVVMRNAFREGLKALTNNEIVALIADQSGPESGIYVDFFGRPASTHQGPAIFQVRSGAPMILVMLIRESGGKCRLEVEEIETGDLTGSNEEKIQIVTERHVKALERYVRRYPDHWLWMHKRWKHTDKYVPRKAQSGHDAIT